jgi:hypothetical protein
MSGAAQSWLDRITDGLSLMFFGGTPWQERMALDAWDEVRALRREANGCERLEICS